MYYIYAESVLLINFCINLILLYVLAKINKRKFLILRSIIAALIGAVYALLFIMNLKIFTYPFLKVVIAFLMVFISINKAHIKTILLLSIQYFFLAFICAGAVLFISHFVDQKITNISGVIVAENITVSKIITVISIICVFTIIISEIIKNKNILAHAEIIIKCNDITCKILGFADNGNLLKTINGKNVILIEKQSIKKILKESLYIDIDHIEEGIMISKYKKKFTIVSMNTAAGSKNIICFQPDEIQILYDNCIHDVSGNALIGILEFPLYGLSKDLKAIFNPILLTKGNECLHE
jgi:sigma-E processing peptidase SpoIIGA